jgi:hypothetical protein
MVSRLSEQNLGSGSVDLLAQMDNLIGTDETLIIWAAKSVSVWRNPVAVNVSALPIHLVVCLLPLPFIQQPICQIAFSFRLQPHTYALIVDA